jgi:hypothetical protein
MPTTFTVVPSWLSPTGRYRGLDRTSGQFDGVAGCILNPLGLAFSASLLFPFIVTDRKSRHRRIKKQRRYERLAATSQLSLW